MLCWGYICLEVLEFRIKTRTKKLVQALYIRESDKMKNVTRIIKIILSIRESLCTSE